MKFFKPIEVKEKYIDEIVVGLNRYLGVILFNKIFSILKDTSINNGKNALIEAIKSGRVYYKNGAFRTDKRFSNAISLQLEKIGAKLKNGAYHLKRELIPPEILQAINNAEILAKARLFAISQYLNSYEIPQVDLKEYIEKAVTNMFKTLELDIYKEAKNKNVPVIELGFVEPKVTVSEQSEKDISKYWQDKEFTAAILHSEWEQAKESGDSFKIREAAAKLAKFQKEKYHNAPQLEYTIDDVILDEQASQITQDYIYNMRYWVQNWTVKEIVQMRKDVFAMVQKGVREAEIAKYFQRRWKIAENKAKFLAHNESHLASAVIIKTQFEKLGAWRFKWLRSTAVEKRKLHKEYYGKIFEFDNPPVIDEKLDIKGLPRQIWNCMCGMAIVVPSFAETQARKLKNQENNTIIGKIKNAITGRQRYNYLNRYRRFDQRQTL